MNKSFNFPLLYGNIILRDCKYMKNIKGKDVLWEEIQKFVANLIDLMKKELNMTKK